MAKHQISDLLDELQSNEAYVRSDAIKRIIKERIDDEQIIVALKDIIENDSSMAVRNFARSAFDVFNIEHSAVEVPSEIDFRNSKSGNKNDLEVFDKNSIQKNEKNGFGCFGIAVVTILVVAAILLILTSFMDGFSAGIFQMVILFFGAIALVGVILIGVITQSIRGEKKDNSSASDNSLGTPDSEQELNVPSQQSSPAKGSQILFIATAFGIIGIIAVYTYLYRENIGVNQEWIYRAKPENSPIAEVRVLSQIEPIILVKTQAGNYYYTSPFYCEKNCWDNDRNYQDLDPEEYTINDPLCKAKASPSLPPEGQTGDELIFRDCPYTDTQETRIVLAKNGGLWIWYKWVWGSIVGTTFGYSLLVAPIFSLVGILFYNAFKSTKN